MKQYSNNSVWLGLGLAAGAAWSLSRWLRRRQISSWQKVLQPGDHPVALVTGASSGIGEIYSRRLSELGFDLVLVARRIDRLEALAQEFTLRLNRQVEVLPADLADPRGISKVENRLSHGDITFLVNNAGYGIPGTFIQIPIDRIEAQIRVHILASVRLTKAALPGMLERGKGVIINVSSLASFFALPGDATYGPTKTYLNQFTQSLALSLAGRGILLQALCPGFTVTGFHSTPHYSGIDVRDRIPNWLWMQSKDVVEASLRSLRSGGTICVPGWQNKILYYFGITGIAQFVINLVSLTNPELIRKLREYNIQQ